MAEMVGFIKSLGLLTAAYVEMFITWLISNVPPVT